MKCTECGRKIGDNHKFCKYCGFPVKQIIISAESMSQTKKCKVCGVILEPEVSFCTQCGTPVFANEVKASTTKEKNKHQGGKGGKIIIVVLTLIVVALIAFVGYYFANQSGVFDHGKKEPTNSESTEDDEPIYEEVKVTETVSEEATKPEEPEEPAVTADPAVTDVEAIVLQIRDKYNRIVNGISSNSYDITVVAEGAIAYSEQNEIKAIVVKKDYEGYGYARYYYYDGDKLVFAYYEGSDSHRLYFDEERLIRWRYCADAEDISNAINYDLENTSEYDWREKDTLAESKKLLFAWKNACANEISTQEYILVGSNSRYILKSELQEFTAEQCRLARNEIYARHGRRFEDESLRDYFNSKSWYTPTIDPNEFEESLLNPYEIANRDLIVEYEEECGY